MLSGGNNINKVTAFKTGSCSSIEVITKRGGSFKKVHFPSLVFLIEHSSGLILFDTGYGDHFFHASQSFPYRLYRMTTPVTYSKTDSIYRKLKNKGIDPTQIKRIILSHFHGDHTGGLLDFPQAKIICSKKGWDDVKNLTGVAAVKKAYLPETIPDDFETRTSFIEQTKSVTLSEEYAPFKKGFDLFGDGSIIAVFLEGHAKGQFGVLIGQTFLCADAAWSQSAIQTRTLPSKLTKLIIPSWDDYIETFDQLTDLYTNNPQIHIIPSHCTEVGYE